MKFKKKQRIVCFIPVFFLVFLASCVSKKQTAFIVENTPNLYALSGKAAKGIVSLSKPVHFEYEFETPLLPDSDSSLEVEYLLRRPPAFQNSTAAEYAAAEGQVILDLGDFSWELPVDFSYLGSLVSQESETFTIKYAIPLTQVPVEKIVLHYETEEKQNKEAPILELKSITLAERWFGFSQEPDPNGETNRYLLSPFVTILDSGLTIDPPPQLRDWSGSELRIAMNGENVSLSAGEKRFESVSPGLNVPAVFMNHDNFPISIAEGEKTKEALLIPARERPLPEPIPTDPGMITAWPKEAWRDSRFELFSLERFPSVLIFDMADYAVQDRFLKRIAFFVEKANYRGRLVSPSEVANLRGWNAHDYRASSLADFFETARKQNAPLLNEELELKNILFDAGIIRPGSDGSIVPGEGAILSISRESPDYLRSTFIIHETFHGLYFIDEDFRDFCYKRWNAFQDPGRHFFLSFLGRRLYDITNKELVVTEFMSYLLQQGLARTEAYFTVVFSNEPIDVSPLQMTALPEALESYNTEAAAFSVYVNQRWGMEAGRVRAVTIR